MKEIQLYWEKINKYFTSGKNVEERNKFLFLLGGFLVLVVLVIILSFFGNNKPVASVVSPPAPKTNTTDIYFSPGETAISLATAEKEYRYPIYIQANENSIAGIQVKIHYDPSVFTNVSIVKDVYLKNSVILMNKVDPKNDAINFAIGIEPKGIPSSGNGVFATLILHLNPKLSSASLPMRSVIYFLPGSSVGDISYQYSSLRNATGEIFTISK